MPRPFQMPRTRFSINLGGGSLTYYATYPLTPDEEEALRDVALAAIRGLEAAEHASSYASPAQPIAPDECHESVTP